MTDILSQNDIDALLTSISAGDVRKPEPEADHGRVRIKIYDFRRPDKFTKAHMRTLEAIHASFARLTTAMLTAGTGTNAGIYVASLDWLTYEEFTRSLPGQALMAVYNMKPLAGPVIMEIDPSISGVLIECLCGGKPSSVRASGEITDIEKNLIERIFGGFAANLCYSWKEIIELQPEFVKSGINPYSVKAALPGDMVMLISLEAKIGNVEGMINIAFPYMTLEPVKDRLTDKYMHTASNRSNETDPVLDIDDSCFKRHVLYSGAAAGMIPDDIRNIKPGTRIPLTAQCEAEAVYEYTGLKKGGDND